MTILACLILSGCVGEVETTEVATKKTMTSERTDELLDDKIGEFENGKLTMTVDVPNESFALKTVFTAEDYAVDRWRTTDVKKLKLSACTVGLPEENRIEDEVIDENKFILTNDDGQYKGLVFMNDTNTVIAISYYLQKEEIMPFMRTLSIVSETKK